MVNFTNKISSTGEGLELSQSIDIGIEELLEFFLKRFKEKRWTPLKNIQISNGPRNHIGAKYTKDYIYSTNLEIEFSGNFGKSPSIYMVYSPDSSIVTFDHRKLIDKNIINKTRDGLFTYRFEYSKQYTHSNVKSQLTKVYLILVEGRHRLGKGYVISQEKPFGKVNNYGSCNWVKPFLEFSLNTHPVFIPDYKDLKQVDSISEEEIRAFKKIEKTFKDLS